MHASEDDLILHYYGEADDDGKTARHVSACPDCQNEFARLGRALALVEAQAVPEPSPSFERQVWARLQPQLDARGERWIPRLWSAVPHWAFAGGVASLVLAAFLAGRFTARPIPLDPSEADADVRNRVLLVAVVDHLDRSQMVLVEVLNAEPHDAAAFSIEQERARELVAESRLYRQSAAYTGEEILGTTLEDLERVLLELANAPADATRESLAALREQIGAGGLLFRVRVVQSEIREKQRLDGVIG